MAKKRPQTTAKRPQLSDAEVPVVGAREPCPCGSGRRYKACHGRAAAHAVTELVQRPFEGLPGEGDWVALRELVPAATVALPLKGGLPEGVPSVTLATVLPMAWPALRRDDGSVLLGLQNDTASGDISRDLADTLQRALAADPGTPVQARRAPAEGPRLQDLLDPEGTFEPVVHPGFEFWVPEAENAAPEVTASLERANAAAIPTVKLQGVDAAYWCETPDKNHLRWVMPYPEEQLLDGLARCTPRAAPVSVRAPVSWGPSVLTVSPSPSGTCRAGSARTTSRSRPPSSPSASPPRWPRTRRSPRTSAARGAVSPTGRSR
jgi:hypothetical protein